MINCYNLISINEFTYKLKINGNFSDQLYYTIEKTLKSAHFDNGTNSIFFSAENVIPLKKYIVDKKNKTISYATCIKLIDDLSKQIFYLKELNYGFYGFDIDDILIIDDNFIFCSCKYLLELDNDNIMFTSPIKQPYFSNPELFKLTSLPSKINHKCCYYSLGSLVVFLLLNNYLLVGNELKKVEEINRIIQPLYNTKIYWFIKRCLDDDINNRKLLLV
jgi:hypothetical protein